MQEFTAVEQLPTRSPEMKIMQRWVRKKMCLPNSGQNLVGNREYAPGKTIEQWMVDDPNDRRAHVCPFVLDSIDARSFWIEESDLDDSDPLSVENLLVARMHDFVSTYDPSTTKQPAGPSRQLRVFFIFFPNFHNASCGQLIPQIHSKLKSSFMEKGLMLGEFFRGYKSCGIYTQTGKWHALTSPLPAFAIRYMIQDDWRFTPVSLRTEYEKYWGKRTW